ncbi:uncharacterized protein LOC129350679 [Amphiprion ocellaris]|uniref:uncharacterized protein LOC129350679 n=1 Tax=Amphiprion ocellaris TaxID=80972 RepID=UPI002410E41A|nr:uncharacterized protein LOC129350679 [Amphiprion ocellaris]
MEFLKNRVMKVCGILCPDKKQMLANVSLKKFVVACFCKDRCSDSKRGHYHCPLCNYQLLSRLETFKYHMQRIHVFLLFSVSESKEPSQEKLSCQHCGTSFSTFSNLRKHLRQVHNINTLPMVYIDSKNGIYVTPRFEHGPLFPIHVIKSTNTPTIDFSVFTNTIDNWCKFGRTRVSFDFVSGKWNCQCRGTTRSHGCIHRMLATWWIFQESPQLLLHSTDVHSDDTEDLETELHETQRDFSNYACSEDKVFK